MIEQQSRENMAGVRVRGGGRVRQQVRVSSVRSGQVGECLKSMLTILASRAVVVRHSSLCFGEVRYNNKFDLQTSCSCRGGHIRLCRFRIRRLRKLLSLQDCKSQRGLFACATFRSVFSVGGPAGGI